MSIQIGSVTIDRNPTWESRDDTRKQSQFSREFEDGTIETYSTGRTMIYGTIYLEYVPKDKYREFKEWLETTINFTQFTFNIIPPSFFDLGLGEGVAISGATYDGPPNTKEVFTPVGRLGAMNIAFPFKVAKPIESGLVDINGVIAS